MKIHVVDNFFPVELVNRLLTESHNYEWSFCREDNLQDIYWTKFVYGNEFKLKNNRVIDKFTEPTIEEAWDYFSNKFNISKDKLLSVYLNGLTYGVEAHQHTDSDYKEDITVICYLCENWNSHWAGATNFYDGEFVTNPAAPVFYANEINKSVLPKYNRIVFFDSNIIHGVTPLSKSFKGLRKTLMFKLEHVSYEELCKYAT